MFKSKDIAKALFEMVLKGADPEVVATSFFDFAKTKNLLNQIDGVLYHLDLLMRSDYKNKSLTIVSKHEVSIDLINKIKDKIKIGNDIEIIKEERSDLIGGFVAKYNGKIYDGSLKSQLHKMSQFLKS